MAKRYVQDGPVGENYAVGGAGGIDGFEDPGDLLAALQESYELGKALATI